MSLIANQPQWRDLDVEGENTPTKYHGKFCLKPFLNHAEKTDAIRLAERYCLGIIDHTEHRLFLTALAFLKFHIVEYEAPWWDNDGLEFYDESPVWKLTDILREVQGKKEKENKEEKAKELKNG